jgi:hypothetical protein
MFKMISKLNILSVSKVYDNTAKMTVPFSSV